MAADKLNVFLVAGGDSSERDVSLDTGKSVHGALIELGHRVVVADPGRPQIRPSEDATALFSDASIKKEPPGLSGGMLEARRRFVGLLGSFDEFGCDVVFNGLHGGVGEDGTFQAVLDYMGIRYTGSGHCAAAAAMNKHLSKQIVAHAGVPVPDQVFVDSAGHESVVSDEQVLESLSLPAVVKPNDEGSSVGVTIARTQEELRRAIEDAKQFGGRYLVERFIPGKEITASIVDQCELPLIEIVPKTGFFNYENKYQPGSCDYLVPAPLPDDTTEKILSAARASYRALGCRGYSRIDFRLTKDGECYFLEANTLPGLTSGSLVPKAARAAGIEYLELVDRILRLSLADDAVG